MPQMTAMTADRSAWDAVDGPVGAKQRTFIRGLWVRVPRGLWAARHSRGTKSVADRIKFPGVDDPRDIERWNPKLPLVE